MAEFALMEQLDLAIDALLAGAGKESADPAVAGLMEIAGTLRDLPDDGFKTRLKRELLQRRTPMTAPMATRTAAIHAVTPFISVAEGGKLIDFLKSTFDAEETNRHPHGPDGFVANLKIGDSDLLVMGGESLRGQERPAALHVFVKDCDATYRRALDAGAITVPPGVGEPADRPYGERSGFVKDPFGDHWFIATRPGPQFVPEGLKQVTPYLHPAKAADLIDFMKRAFGAEEVARYEHAGRVMHASVRIGGSVVEMGEAGEDGPPPAGLYLQTDDVDSVYRNAMEAGAVSIAPPADQAYGERIAVFLDPTGNLWTPAQRLM